MGCLCEKQQEQEAAVSNPEVALTVTTPKDRPFLKKRSSRVLNSEDGEGLFQNRQRKETTFPTQIAENRGNKSIIPGKKSM